MNETEIAKAEAYASYWCKARPYSEQTSVAWSACRAGYLRALDDNRESKEKKRSVFERLKKWISRK